MNNKYISILILLILLTIFLCGCEELEKLDDPNYVNVVVTCSVDVKVRIPNTNMDDGTYHETFIDGTLINVEIIKDGGERVTEVIASGLPSEGKQTSVQATFKLYKEQPINCIANVVLGSIPSEYSDYIFYGDSETIPWGEVYPTSDFSETSNKMVRLEIGGYHPDLTP